MKVLVIGGGAREHAVVKALARQKCDIYSVMSNKNPGIAQAASDVLYTSETDVDAICDFAIQRTVDIAFVGPEAPLAAGVTDALLAVGIHCASPKAAAARIETSKTYMRELLSDYDIDGNLGYAQFSNAQDAIEYVKKVDYPVAIKPVGLTGGKGVKVQGDQLKSLEDTIAYINEIFDTGLGGGEVIIEEKAEGEEFTQMVFCNGNDIIPMPLVQDHKRAYEGDTGPNTGGMGSYSDQNHLLPFVTEEDRIFALRVLKTIVLALKAEGHSYHGVMYGQFMLTKTGPKVIEINARFGDPEAMNVMSILGSNIFSVLEWMSGIRKVKRVQFKPKATVCKYVVPAGYGVKSESGHEITVDEKGAEEQGAMIYYGSVYEKDGKIVTGTSRAVGVVGIGDTIEEAEKNCERALNAVSCDAIYIRHDIGTQALIQKRIDHMKAIRG